MNEPVRMGILSDDGNSTLTFDVYADNNTIIACGDSDDFGSIILEPHEVAQLARDLAALAQALGVPSGES